MAFNNNPYDKYKSTQIQTATPGQLIIMLYDGAIKFCKFSKNAIIEKDISNSNKYLIKVQDIITELMISLDMKAGGDIAKNLYSIYDYMLRTLVSANMKKDIDKITEIQELLEDLKESWMEAVKKTGGVKPRR